ncbi:MAG: STAS domain-containing protein [Clostridia bacterium]|nr:STAS domain-containing protein [Clostridia bacterium]
MTITTEKNNNAATLKLDGRLDTATASTLETALFQLGDEINQLTLDMSGVQYVSSAGLRVLLSAHKKYLNAGGLKLTNVCEGVMDVFEITGFADFLVVE